MSRIVSFYLNGRPAGKCELPLRFLRVCDTPLSYHYFDPASGLIWATVEIPNTDWNTYRIPSLSNKLAAYERWPRGLQLTWLFGQGFYESPELLLLPRAVLEHEFHCQDYNLKRNLG